MNPEPPEFDLPTPGLELLCDLWVDVAPAIEVGLTPQGLRRVIPITGGRVSGARLQGRLLAAGADFQLVVGGTTAQLDARYVIGLDDGTRVFVQNQALRVASASATARMLAGEPVDPAEVYFRCQPRFEVADGPWSWLTQSQFVGTGVRLPQAVLMRFFRVV
jgi:hypothetical protein